MRPSLLTVLYLFSCGAPVTLQTAPTVHYDTAQLNACAGAAVLAQAQDAVETYIQDHADDLFTITLSPACVDPLTHPNSDGGIEVLCSKCAATAAIQAVSFLCIPQTCAGP